MEEVRCPGCGGMIPFPEGKTPTCPRCGQGIDVVDGGGGMWILGLREPPPPSVLAPQPHDDDPLVRKYVLWKGIGVTLISLGVASLLILFIDIWTAYFGGAFYFGLVHYFLTGLGLFLVVGGVLFFLAGWSFKNDRLRKLDNIPV
jgi:hypothetical protein